MTNMRVCGMPTDNPKTEICITRLKAFNHEILGRMEVRIDAKVIWACGCLELPWRENKKNISCIPRGRYRAWKRESAKHGHHIMLGDVPGRSMILIHAGNSYKDTKGCILPGYEFGDINEDGIGDALSSRATLAHLLQTIPERFEVFFEVPIPKFEGEIKPEHLLACRESLWKTDIPKYFNPYINWHHLGLLHNAAVKQKWPVADEGFLMDETGPREWACNLMHGYKDHVDDTSGLDYGVG